MEPVYRRSLPAASRPERELSSPALCCEGAEDAAGDAEARWLDWARFPAAAFVVSSELASMVYGA